MIGGAGVAAAGAMAQGQAQASAARYNATLAERQSVAISAQVANQVARQRQEAEMTQGTLLAGYGASGVSTDDGSPMDVLRMSIANAKLDEHNLIYRGQRERLGLADSATLDRMRATTAESQAGFNAASSLLTGAGNAWYASTVASKGTNESAYKMRSQPRAKDAYIRGQW
jgi:hypothetical protein